MLPNFSSKHTTYIAFDLSSNNFEGPLPLFPSNLAALDLSNNKLSGSISSICEIPRSDLRFLNLANNPFSGVLPDCFLHLQQMKVLNLGNNSLSGEIPSSIGSLFFLENLSLHHNNFVRELPASLKNCSSLMFLDLSENRLSGEIPAWIGESLPNLTFLSLQSNEFFGSIPLHLCQLAQIQILDLSQNNVSGRMPKCLENWSSMVEKGEEVIGGFFVEPRLFSEVRFAYYYINKFYVAWKGRKYEYGRNLALLRVIDFSGSKLTGEIPEEITGLLQLMALNLSRNNLIGVIPQKIGQLKQLESLDLSGNQLSGAIPMSMADLNFLSHLDLAYNNLSGKIPTGTQLQSFDSSAFIGNLALCGLPLTQTCPGDGPPGSPTDAENQVNGENADDFKKWIYMGMGAGYGACFWGVLGALLLRPSWRSSYFHFLEESWNWLYVTLAVFKVRLQQKCKS